MLPGDQEAPLAVDYKLVSPKEEAAETTLCAP